MASAKSPASFQSSATIGFEAKLWLAADKLRNKMDAAVTERSDKRRQQPEPYKHFIRHLAPQGMAGFFLANGSMSSNQSGEGDIRRALIEADLVDCMVALPGQLFYSTQIPVCLWFLAKNKNADAKRDFRDRRKQTLFIDARKLGTLIDRVHRELTDAYLEKINSAPAKFSLN